MAFHKGRPGFAPGLTLVELLVVVAVIAILGGLLFPVFAKVRERAHQAVCLSNLKQIGGAFDLYLRDWDDAYPLLALGDMETPYRNWLSSLLPYLRSVEAAVCPTNPYAWRHLGAVDAWGKPVVPLMPVSYGMNGWFPPHPESVREWDISMGLALEPMYHFELHQPAHLILVGETRISYEVIELYASRDALQGWDIHRWDPPLSPWQGVLHTHLGEVNFLFADGHAKPMRVADTLYPLDMWHIRGKLPDKARQLLLATILPEYQ